MACGVRSRARRHVSRVQGQGARQAVSCRGDPRRARDGERPVRDRVSSPAPRMAGLSRTPRPTSSRAPTWNRPRSSTYFQSPCGASNLSFSEWDRHLPWGTTFLTLKISGPAQRQLSAVKTETPGPGEAVASYARSAAPEISNETRATSGSVTLMTLVPRSFATVSFSLAFGSNPLIGDITATFCPGGHEP